jgi:hypothetical protein
MRIAQASLLIVNILVLITLLLVADTPLGAQATTELTEGQFQPTWEMYKGKYEYIHPFPEQVPTIVPGVDPKHTIPRERACTKIRHILGFRVWSENACYDYYTQELEV